MTFIVQYQVKLRFPINIPLSETMKSVDGYLSGEDVIMKRAEIRMAN